jgi:hypothetical protein
MLQRTRSCALSLSPLARPPIQPARHPTASPELSWHMLPAWGTPASTNTFHCHPSSRCPAPQSSQYFSSAIPLIPRGKLELATGMGNPNLH